MMHQRGVKRKSDRKAKSKGDLTELLNPSAERGHYVPNPLHRHRHCRSRSINLIKRDNTHESFVLCGFCGYAARSILKFLLINSQIHARAIWIENRISSMSPFEQRHRSLYPQVRSVLRSSNLNRNKQITKRKAIWIIITRCLIMTMTMIEHENKKKSRTSRLDRIIRTINKIERETKNDYFLKYQIEEREKEIRNTKWRKFKMLTQSIFF